MIDERLILRLRAAGSKGANEVCIRGAISDSTRLCIRGAQAPAPRGLLPRVFAEPPTSCLASLEESAGKSSSLDRRSSCVPVRRALRAGAE